MSRILGSIKDYQQQFNPRTFVNEFIYDQQLEEPDSKSQLCSEESHEILQDFILTNKLEGERLLVVGAGPTVKELAYLVPHYRKVVLSDPCEQNLAELRKWVAKDPDAIKWSLIFKHYSQRAGNGYKGEELEALARKSVIGIEFGNLLEEDPFGNLQLEPFDAIIAPHCLGALGSYDQQVQSIRNLCISYLKPGGYFMILDMAHEAEYKVGGKPFQWVSIPAEKFKTMCGDASLEVKTFHTCVDSPNGVLSSPDSDIGDGGMVVVVGRFLG